jgi:hypothetical protein
MEKTQKISNLKIAFFLIAKKKLQAKQSKEKKEQWEMIKSNKKKNISDYFRNQMHI